MAKKCGCNTVMCPYVLLCLNFSIWYYMLTFSFFIWYSVVQWFLLTWMSRAQGIVVLRVWLLSIVDAPARASGFTWKWVCFGRCRASLCRKNITTMMWFYYFINFCFIMKSCVSSSVLSSFLCITSCRTGIVAQNIFLFTLSLCLSTIHCFNYSLWLKPSAGYPELWSIHFKQLPNFLVGEEFHSDSCQI